jgi:hypothetical protein
MNEPVPQPVGMRWVHAKPNTDGFYWQRDRVGSIVTERVVNVSTMTDGVRYAYYAGEWQPVGDLWQRMANRMDFEFSSCPIYKPSC